jgi:hypothetical protein
MILCVIWTVLMIFWILGGCYVGWDPNKPAVLVGGTLVPWVCVLILGLILFGAFSVETTRVIR